MATATDITALRRRQNTLIIACLSLTENRRKRNAYARQILRKRSTHSEYHNLVQEMRIGDSEYHHRYVMYNNNNNHYNDNVVCLSLLY